MNIKHIIAIGFFMMAGFATQSFGVTIDGVEVENGENLQVGSEFYFADGIDTQGIGQILEIRNANGDVIWEDGDNGVDLWFVFDDLVVENVYPTPTGDVITTTGGTLQYFTLADGVFNQTGDFANDAAAIATGDLWLDTVLAEIDYGPDTFSTLNLTVGNTGFNGTGFLDVVGGSAASVLNTNSIGNPYDNQQSDVRWNFSVDNEQQYGDYNYTGSSDFRTVAQIPLPAPLALMGLGIIGMMGARKFI